MIVCPSECVFLSCTYVVQLSDVILLLVFWEFMLDLKGSVFDYGEDVV